MNHRMSQKDAEIMPADVIFYGKNWHDSSKTGTIQGAKDVATAQMILGRIYHTHGVCP